MTEELNVSRETKLAELKVQQAKLAELQAELEVINSKVVHNEKLSPEDTAFVSNLGWLAALAATIASIAATL